MKKKRNRVGIMGVSFQEGGAVKGHHTHHQDDLEAGRSGSVFTRAPAEHMRKQRAKQQENR